MKESDCCFEAGVISSPIHCLILIAEFASFRKNNDRSLAASNSAYKFFTVYVDKLNSTHTISLLKLKQGRRQNPSKQWRLIKLNEERQKTLQFDLIIGYLTKA